MNLKNEIPYNIPINEIILQSGIANNAQDLCQKYGKRGFVVVDENTRDFVKLPYDKLVLPKKYKPTLETAQQIAKQDADFFVAVGSGSLNDMVKYASHAAGKPYIVFATAASMNGYASANASLIVDGFKKSFYAHTPTAIYMDLEIIKNAPTRLRISGIGDSICRATCQADAILSNQICGTPDYADLFEMISRCEEKIFDDVEALCKTLIFSGVAMYVAKSSAPASQGEHMLAHYMELMHPDAPHSYHGEQIAVTTLTMAQLQEKAVSEGSFEIGDEVIADINSHFGKEFGAYCTQQTQKKYAAAKNLTQKIKPFISSADLRTKLKNIGAPLAAKDIGWDEKIYSNAIKYAKYTRDRLTFLDLLYS